MSAEDRRKAFAHRINQLVGDHYRAGFVESVKARRDIGERIHSALEDAYQMGLRQGVGLEHKPAEEMVERDAELCNCDDEGVHTHDKVAERIEPQEP